MTTQPTTGRVSLDIRYFPDDPSPANWPYPVVALGNFDGLHRGHQKIIDRVGRQAREHGGTALVMAFEPHPPRVVRPDKAPPLLMTRAQRLEAIARAGIEGVVIVRFTPELSRWEPEHFVREVLIDWLRVAEVWVGGNFLFGRDRSGNFSLLRALGQDHGFKVEKIDPVRYKDFIVSSTRIRRLVAEGRVDEAGALLGHHYYVDGLVVPGAGRGRGLGFPTANLQTENELLPPHGVYATTVTIDSAIHAAVTNVGLRPTFGDLTTPIVETHLLDFDRDLAGARVRLAFVQRMRPEKAFANVEALRAQVTADCAEARALFGRISL
ncbi:MAG: bifunctional riboflavin kinase/FAD synthetase [Luteitalea sp.]|nr:bifunctional riboflavin kinase/FAD synthetase [Luteitalea sp.]